MQFSFSTKMVTLLQSGFQSRITFCSVMRKAFSFFGGENNIIPGRKLYLVELDY